MKKKLNSNSELLAISTFPIDCKLRTIFQYCHLAQLLQPTNTRWSAPIKKKYRNNLMYNNNTQSGIL